MAALENTSLPTMISLFYTRERENPDRVFLKQPFGKQWHTLTWKRSGQIIRKLANALLQTDLPRQSKIGIYSKNCMHFVLADLAINMAGHISVPFYHTLKADELEKVLTKGDVKILFAGKLDEWEMAKKGIPTEVEIIRFPHYPVNAEIQEGTSWEDFIGNHEPLTGYPEPHKDDIWTIIFTSGTTGDPKGVMLCHAGAARYIQNEVEHDHTHTGHLTDHRFFSYLPMNHIGERIAVEGLCLFHGGSIAFAESPARFVQNLREAAPTIFLGVPRVYMMFQSGVLEKLPQRRIDRLLKIPVISGLVKRRIKKGLGLHQAKIMFCGAAPLSPDFKQWYQDLDMKILEGYGLTEAMGVNTISSPDYIHLNTVGRPMANTQINIHEETGDIFDPNPAIFIL